MAVMNEFDNSTKLTYYAGITSFLSDIGRLRGLSHDYIMQSLTENGADDIIPQHGDIIVALSCNGLMNMGELAVSTKRKKNTLTTLVQSLERNGYVTREANGRDARVQQVKLTEKGWALARLTIKISTDIHELMWQGVTFEEREQMRAVVNKVIDNFTAAANEDEKP